MKPKTRPQWCQRRLIGNPFYMGICLSEAAFHAALRHAKVPRADWSAWIRSPQADATSHTLESSAGRRIVLVCLRGWEKRCGIEIAGLLVHEAVHIWQQVREYVGEDNPSSEFEAYSVQAIAQDLMQGFIDAGGVIA